MRFRKRSHDEPHEQHRQAPVPSAPSGGSVSQLRQAGEDFLKAGDEAISRALSSNSEAFLAANQQQGGE